MQDCSISIASALEILQFCTKFLILVYDLEESCRIPQTLHMVISNAYFLLFTDLDGDAEVKVTLPEDGEHWKTKIIIGCTVTAAVEILVVIFIVAYWREIRWTLRKFSCPCVSWYCI